MRINEMRRPADSGHSGNRCGDKKARTEDGSGSVGANRKKLREALRQIHEHYNHREFVHPDPLEFLYRYPDKTDREIVGLIASSLAYGRVNGIIRSVGAALKVMGNTPRYFVETTGRTVLENNLSGFRHRFTTGKQLAAMLYGIKRLLKHWRSLGECFAAGFSDRQDTVLDALAVFCDRVKDAAGNELKFLLPSPKRGSACKRLNLFLRWMVRNDEVDPGGWNSIPPSKLVVPLDAHMFSIGKALGFTGRKTANLAAALDITLGFREIEPEDPAMYDFALTRPGIRGENEADFLESIRKVTIGTAA